MAEGVLCGLTENGIGAAYCIHTGRQLCILNKDSTQVVRSLFFNQLNRTLITVSTHEGDDYGCLRCHQVTLAQLRAGEARDQTALFVSESFQWPGFVEFDDVNGKVLTFCADHARYRVWCMRDLSVPIFSVSDVDVPLGIKEIKISPALMLIVCKSDGVGGMSLPLRLISAENGSMLRELRQPIRKGRRIGTSPRCEPAFPTPSPQRFLTNPRLLYSRALAQRSSNCSAST